MLLQEVTKIIKERMNSFPLTQFEIQPISERDAWRLCDFIVSNEDFLKRYFPQTVVANRTPELSNSFVYQKVSEFTAKKEYLFTIKELEHRSIIGLVYVKEIDRQLNEAEIAYCIGYTHKNKGFASLAVQTISEWAFKEQQIARLRILVHKSNFGSLKVAEKCGYLWEKTIVKEHTPPNEPPLDMELYVHTNER